MDKALADELLALCEEEQEFLRDLQRDPQLTMELEAAAGKDRLIPAGASFALIAVVEMARRSSVPDRFRQYLAVHAYVGWHLERVVLAYGWPGADLVGAQAAEAFSAILAHADDRPALRLQAIDAALRYDGRLRSDIDGRQYGHVVDRTQVILQAPQIYGTYLVPTPRGAELVWPVKDDTELDVRRERIRLPPLQHDIELYERGATPGPFLTPVTPHP